MNNLSLMNKLSLMNNLSLRNCSTLMIFWIHRNNDKTHEESDSFAVDKIGGANFSRAKARVGIVSDTELFKS